MIETGPPACKQALSPAELRGPTSTSQKSKHDDPSACFFLKEVMVTLVSDFSSTPIIYPLYPRWLALKAGPLISVYKARGTYSLGRRADPRLLAIVV